MRVSLLLLGWPGLKSKRKEAKEYVYTKNIVGLESDITRCLRGCGSQFHGIGYECLKRSGCS